MTSILMINSSLNGEAGNSNQLTQYFAQALSGAGEAKLVLRGLDADTPHLSAEEMQAWMTPADERSAEQAELAAISDTMVAEVQAADVIVLGVPMYNFGIPSPLKAWIDRIARAGVTFKYTENGPVGLLAGKQVLVLAARGGKYAGTPKDTQTQYLKDFFAFLGLDDIAFVYAEGLAMGDEPRAQAMNAAFTAIDNKVAGLVDASESAA